MAVTVNLGAERLRLFNVHIDPHGPRGNQHAQTESLLERVNKGEEPTVVLGDFNTLSKQKATEIRKLMESQGFSTPFSTDVATWRGAGLRFHADWIFVRGARVIRSGVARALNVSDHWPVWAEIELPI